MKKTKNKIVFVAIDTSNLNQAKKIINHTQKHKLIPKFGLQFFYSKNGRKFLEDYRSEFMLDIKASDIPQTISSALHSIRDLKPKYLKLNPWGTVPFLVVKNKVISESIAICKYLDHMSPSPSLFGSSPIEKATIEMFRRKVEFDGMQAAGEAFRNSVKSFKDRAFAGPGKIPQIPQLIERGKARTEVFFDFLNKVLKKTKYVAGNKFSIADIDAYVTLSFAKWIKIDGTEKRK